MIDLSKLTALINDETGEVKFFRRAWDAIAFRRDENGEYYCEYENRTEIKSSPWDYFTGEDQDE